MMNEQTFKTWRYGVLVGLALLCFPFSDVALAQRSAGQAVATIDPRTGEAQVNRAVLKQRFPNGQRITSIEIEKSGRQFFLVRTASSAGKCQTTATPLQEVGGSLMLARRAGGGGGLGATASCSGDPCSSCKFTYTGDVVTGCRCDGQPGGKCNHTITSTTLRKLFVR